MTWRPRYSELEVREAVANAASMSGALRALGLRPAGGNFRSLRKLIAHYGVSTAHFEPNWALRAGRTQVGIALEQILVDGSTYNRGRLKERLYETGLKSRQCEQCGQGEDWRGRKMSLILDHINGVPTDNRLENLQIVCPNCAATLDTHCGRKNRLVRDPQPCLNCGVGFVPKYARQRYCSRRCGRRSKGPRRPKPETRKVPRPSHEQLIADLQSLSFVAVGRKYGISDNAVREWLRWYDWQERAGDGGRSDDRAA